MAYARQTLRSETAAGERPQLAVAEEVSMAGPGKDAYVAMIAARASQIRALLDQGFEFVTNALKAGTAPPGLKVRRDREQVRRLRQEGYEVEVTTAYDEQGQPRPTLSAIWRKKR
jgi:ribulose bisphosphate carboxylase small subunit